MLPDDLFESELFRLEGILKALEKVFHAFETQEELDKDYLDQAMLDVFTAMNPEHGLDAEGAGSIPAMTLACEQSHTIATQLLTSWKFARKNFEGDHRPTVDQLMRWSENAKTGPGPSAEELIKDLPWILKGALDYILTSGVYEENPTSGASVAARILITALMTFDGMEGFNMEPPEQEAQS